MGCQQVETEPESPSRHLSPSSADRTPPWPKAALTAAPGQWEVRGHGPPGFPLTTSPRSWPLPSICAGSVPLDPELTRSLEEGRDFIQEFPQSPAFPVLSAIAQKILNETSAQLS